MAYVKTTWVDDVTPLSAANLNNIESGVESVDSELDTVRNELDTVRNGLFVVVTDAGTLPTLQAHSRMAYNINLDTEYNIPTDGSYIPIGFLKIYPQFTDDNCVIQAFDLYTNNSGQIKAVINLCNVGDTNYTDVDMSVKMLLWKKA